MVHTNNPIIKHKAGLLNLSEELHRCRMKPETHNAQLIASCCILTLRLEYSRNIATSNNGKQGHITASADSINIISRLIRPAINCINCCATGIQAIKNITLTQEDIAPIAQALPR